MPPVMHMRVKKEPYNLNLIGVVAIATIIKRKTGIT